MKAVYIHIGLPKTGTTALQIWLERNTRALREKGVFTFDRVEFAHRLAVEGLRNSERNADADVVGILGCELESVTGALRAAILDNDISKIFISSEYFSIADASAVRQILSKFGIFDVTIIVTLRRQDRFIESVYSQEVLMMGRTEAIASPSYYERYDWDLFLSPWANAFDKKIEVLIYDRIVAKGESVNNEIIKKVGGSLYDLASENRDFDEKVNLRVPAKVLEFKRLANSIDNPEFHLLVDRVLNSGIDKTVFRMNSQNANEFMNSYRYSNRKVVRDYLNVDQELFDEADLAFAQDGSDYTNRVSIAELTTLFASIPRKTSNNSDN